jgi:hypothetical protein
VSRGARHLRSRRRRRCWPWEVGSGRDQSILVFDEVGQMIERRPKAGIMVCLADTDRPQLGCNVAKCRLANARPEPDLR